MYKISVGYGLGIFLSRRVLPFERHFALRIHPLGVARRAIPEEQNREPSLLCSVLVLVFTS